MWINISRTPNFCIKLYTNEHLCGMIYYGVENIGRVYSNGGRQCRR